MTAFGRSDIEQSVRNLGGLFYLEKPIDLDLLLVTVETLLVADRGERSGLTLRGFAQFVATQHKTGRLEVRGPHQSGTLHFANGLLIEATTAARTAGQEAALEILSWDEVVLHFAARAELAAGDRQGARRAAASKRRGAGTRLPNPSNWSLAPAWWREAYSNISPSTRSSDMADIKNPSTRPWPSTARSAPPWSDYTSGMCLGMAGGGGRLEHGGRSGRQYRGDAGQDEGA